MQHLEHMRLDARRESNQSMNAKRQVEQNPAILQWKISRWSGSTFWASSTPFLFTWSSALLPSVFHAISMNQQTCRKHQRWWPGATWRVVALNWRLSKQKRQKTSQSHITDLAASYSSMVRIFLSSEHATSHAAMGLGWIIHQIHGTQCFSSSSGQNLSLDVLCFKHKDYPPLKSWSKKNQPRNTQLHKKTKTMNGFKTGVEEVQMLNESHMFQVDASMGSTSRNLTCIFASSTRRTTGSACAGRKKIPWAADTRSFEKKHMDLCFIFEWWLLTNR